MTGTEGTRVRPGAGELPDGMFRRIVDAAGNPFVVVDGDGVVRYAGGSIDLSLDWLPEEVVGRSMLDFILPDHVPAAVEAVREIHDIDRSGAGIPMVFEVYRRDGQRTWVEVGSIPMLDQDDLECIVFRTRGWNGEHHLDEFLRSLLADAPLDDVLTSLARSIGSLLQSRAAVIHHGFDGTDFAASVGGDVPEGCIPIGPGPWIESARSGAPTVTDLSDLPSPLRSVAAAHGLRTLWTVPVPPSDGLAPSVVSVWRTTAGPPLSGHRQAFERMLRYVQLALVRTAEHSRLRYLAGHDGLTGIPNRTSFISELTDVIASDRCIAVAFCDLDGFKAVNDTLGHSAGDAVIIETAERLRGALRQDDLLARMGGDEFTVLYRDVVDSGSIGALVDRLCAAFTEPFHVAGETVRLGLSVGVALAGSHATADEMLAAADEALYEAKRAGGRQARVHAQPAI